MSQPTSKEQVAYERRLIADEFHHSMFELVAEIHRLRSTAHEPPPALRYFATPLRFVEPVDDSDRLGARIVDASGNVVAQLFWPCHPVDETEAAEQETYALGRAMAAAKSFTPMDREALRAKIASDPDETEIGAGSAQPPPVECSHPHDRIIRGHDDLADMAWCDACGVITWASDGPRLERPEGMDRKLWVQQRVVASGCASESRGGKRCAVWCGNPSHCVVSLRATATKCEGRSDG